LTFNLLRLALNQRFWPSGLSPAEAVASDAYFHGQAVWAVLIKANREAYKADSTGKQFGGVVLIAPELAPEEALRQLPPIADWIQNNRGIRSDDWPAAVATFMDWVDDDIMHGAKQVPLPPSISSGLRCSLVTAFFVKTDMPGGSLEMELLPMLFCEAESSVAYAMLVEPKLWPEDYKQQWLNQKKVRQNAQQRANHHPTENSARYFAKEVTGIPPEHLENIEFAVYQQCEERGLHCLFLNVGNLCEANGETVAGSGELQFLGMEEQITVVADTLTSVLGSHLSEDEMMKTRLVGLDLNVFFERFSWLLEEFGKPSGSER
jgi:hypothetical protein